MRNPVFAGILLRDGNGFRNGFGVGDGDQVKLEE